MLRENGRHEAKRVGRTLDVAAWWFRIDLPCSRLFCRFHHGPRRSSPLFRLETRQPEENPKPILAPISRRIKGITVHFSREPQRFRLLQFFFAIFPNSILNWRIMKMYLITGAHYSTPLFILKITDLLTVSLLQNECRERISRKQLETHLK